MVWRYEPVLRESVEGDGTVERNGFSAASMPAAGPVQVADMKRAGPPGWLRPPTSRIVAQSRGSALGTVPSQCGTTWSAAESGHATYARVIVGAGNVVKRN